jgi:hypothetical protein
MRSPDDQQMGESSVLSRGYWPNCMKPQIEITAAITRPTHDTDMGTENGPICTVHRFNSLIRWPIATTAKISAEIATYVDILCSFVSGCRAPTSAVTVMQAEPGLALSEPLGESSVRRSIIAVIEKRPIAPAASLMPSDQARCCHVSGRRSSDRQRSSCADQQPAQSTA